jgi:glycosyltransferase involved in cell wall biosynthesis
MTPPKISVVIGCYNQKPVLERVLPQYAQQVLSTDAFEVIIVDSSSTDGTTEFLANYSAPFQFRHLLRPNRGKAAARNIGVSEARGEWIIISDADMIPEPQFVQAHLEAHLQSSRPTCFEGLAWNMDRLEWPIQKAQLTPQVGTHPRHLAKLGWYYFLTGNISFPKSLFMAFNGFDETFTGYGWEDLELGYRLTQSNVPFLYLRTAVNYHYHLILPKEDIPRCYDKGKSAKIMLKKHPELKLFLGLNPLSVFLFPKISETGALYRWAQKTCAARDKGLLFKWSLWFLKEYHYLKGILS